MNKGKFTKLESIEKGLPTESSAEDPSSGRWSTVLYLKTEPEISSEHCWPLLLRERQRDLQRFHSEDFQARLLFSNYLISPKPEGTPRYTQYVLSAINQVQDTLEELRYESKVDHSKLATDIAGVKESVEESNQILRAFQDNPHDGVVLFAKGLFLCSIVSLVATSLIGFSPLSPSFAAFTLFASIVFGLTAKIDKKKKKSES